MPRETPKRSSPRLIAYNVWIRPDHEELNETLLEMHRYTRIYFSGDRSMWRIHHHDEEELGDFWKQQCIRFHLGPVEHNKVAVVNFYFGGLPGEDQEVQIFIFRQLVDTIVCESDWVDWHNRAHPFEFTKMARSLAIEGDGVTPIEIILRPLLHDVHDDQWECPFFFYGVEWEVIG